MQSELKPCSLEAAVCKALNFWDNHTNEPDPVGQVVSIIRKATRPTANEQDAMDWLVAYTAPALPEEYAYDSDQMIDAFMARCPRIPSALSRNELPADTEEQIARVLFSFIEDEVSFDEAKAANDAGYSWVSDMARAALAKLSAMSSGEPAPDVSNSITRDRSHTADRTIQCEYNSELEPDGKASDKTNRQSGERNESRRRAEILASGNEYGQRDLCAEDRRHDTIDSEGGGEVHSAPTFPAPDDIDAALSSLSAMPSGSSQSEECVNSSDKSNGVQRIRHTYTPHPKYPWFCKVCGYPSHELLLHLPTPPEGEK